MRLLIASLTAVLLSACATQPPAKQVMTACYYPTRQEVAGLFDKWNAALQTLQPKAVVALYASNAVLLPTLSNTPRVNDAEKIDYFEHFLEKHPKGTIDQRYVFTECNAAVDTGLYTFTFKDGSTAKARYTYTYGWNGNKWLITSHHSSLMPEPD